MDSIKEYIEKKRIVDDEVFEKLDKIHKDMITSQNITDSTISAINDLIVWDFGKYDADDVLDIDTLIDLMLDKLDMSSNIEELNKLWKDYRTIVNKVPKPICWVNIINRLILLRFKAICIKYDTNGDDSQLNSIVFKIHNQFISRNIRKLITIVFNDVPNEDDYYENFINNLLFYNYLNLDTDDIDNMNKVLAEIIDSISKKDSIIDIYINNYRNMDIYMLIEVYHELFCMNPIIKKSNIDVIKNLLILRLYFMR